MYDNNSRMFDGTAKLAATDFAQGSSKDAAITGKGGKVTDLKASEPDTPKLDSATEFSLKNNPAALFASARSVTMPQSAPAASESAGACEPYTSGSCYNNNQNDIDLSKTMVKTTEDTIKTIQANLDACRNSPCAATWQKELDKTNVELGCKKSRLAAAEAFGTRCIEEAKKEEEKKKCAAAGKDWVNDACVAKCESWETRNAAGKCERTPIKKPAEVLGIAKGYLGAPYANPADCSKATSLTGLDCSCLAEKTNPGFFKQADTITEKDCKGSIAYPCKNRSQRQYRLMEKNDLLKDNIKDLIPGDYIFYKKESWENNKWMDGLINHVNILIDPPELDEKNRWVLRVYNATPGRPLYDKPWYLTNVEKKKWWEFWKFWKRDKWCQCNDSACTSRECFVGGGFPK